MLVKDWMRSGVITIQPRITINDALNILMENHVNMLPVVEDGKLIGVVSDRDLKHALPSDACLLDFQSIMYQVAKIEVSQVMTPNPITVSSDQTIEETAEILLHNNISGVPVVENDKLVGIITKDDIFAALISLSGLHGKGTLFGFRLEDRPGSIKQATDIIRSYGGRLTSIVSTYETAPEGFRLVDVRAFNLNSADLPKLQEDLSGFATVLYMIDHETNQRIFFNE
jgi:acetoin utilization protein AcuB